MKKPLTTAPVMEKELFYPENRIGSPWRSAKRHHVITVSIILLMGLIAVALVGGYLFNWSWTGFTSSPAHIKTLWDWLQLLITPAVLAVVGYAINFTISNNQQNSTSQRDQTEPEIAIDNRREAALQTYIDRLSDLLLHERLRESQPANEVRKIARIQTLIVLSRLDGERKSSVLLFLHKSHLIDKDKPIIDLSGANLERANLREADLQGAHLVRINLREADLSGANLMRTNLQETDLSGAHLEGAHLEGAHLEGASLDGADLSGADLTEAKVTHEKLKNRT